MGRQTTTQTGHSVLTASLHLTDAAFIAFVTKRPTAVTNRMIRRLLLSLTSQSVRSD
jgi:hypothetical protein